MKDSVIVPVMEASQTAEARRMATEMARGLGFDETETGKVALVVTEAASNLVKHSSRGGEVLLQALRDQRVPGLDIFALDKGPGMLNVGEALRDGYSTANSPGNGLGAIGRLSALFDIYSGPGVGTALMARLWSRRAYRPVAPANALVIGGVSVPKPGEEVCGDAWRAELRPDGVLVLVADGLGHGLDAAVASREATRMLREHSTLKPGELIDAAHGALRATRGAAVAVVELDLARKTVCFAGVGNISGVIRSTTCTKNMVSLNGTVGHELRKVQEFSYPWPDGGLMVLYSDGLATHWNLDRYPGLAERHPSLIAAVLFRDYRRGSDDVTVVVARQLGETG